MAFALVKGIYEQDRDKFAQIVIHDIDDERQRLFAQTFKAYACEIDDLVQRADIILLAVKPAQLPTVLQDIKPFVDKQVILSVAAGISTSQIETSLEGLVPVIRAMPNTPCLVGEGVVVLSPGRYVDAEQIEFVQELLQSVGTIEVLPESDMDAVTAVSGSGPAYVFLIVEAMMDAAVQVGLSYDTARNLVLQTIRGSIKMLEDQDDHPAVLKAQVCSPGGTTIAGVKKLEESAVRAAFFNAIEEAYYRSIELGKHD
ncbi:MAG TPA: pyrroline-5-carboxylate reductase [Syntrophomonadaceae bacterium]|nr:pyrroline-5-carboxylate reductase [Syntrophomonadaceae bacterium]